MVYFSAFFFPSGFLFTSLGQARLLSGSQKRLGGRERALHRLTGFVFKGKENSFFWVKGKVKDSPFCPAEKFAPLLCFCDFHAYKPFSMAKGQFPWAEGESVSQRGDTSPKGQTSQLKIPTATAALQHLKKKKKAGQVSPGNACANRLASQPPFLLKTKFYKFL